MRYNTKKGLLGVICVVSVAWGPAAVVGAYPPDPDNAALVYYQAFLLVEPLEIAEKGTLKDFSRGERELDDTIREEIGRRRTAIEYTATASRIRQCNWGLRFSLGFNASMPHLAQLRTLSRMVLAEARILAADGSWREAFERCLTVKRMGCHAGDETLVSMLVAGALDGSANDCIRDFLAAMPADGETLRWLEAKLVMLSGTLPTATRALEHERQVAMETMRVENRGDLIQIFEGTEVKITPEQLARMDEQFMAENRERYADFVTSMEAILSSPGTYGQRCRKLISLVDDIQESGTREQTALAAALAPGFDKVFSRQVLAETDASATQAAVAIYLVRAETGRLPRTLPEGLPRDPFSGKDFGYERKDDGFVLRCRAKDLAKDTVHEYAFTTR